jgi:hypothetical protein
MPGSLSSLIGLGGRTLIWGNLGTAHEQVNNINLCGQKKRIDGGQYLSFALAADML